MIQVIKVRCSETVQSYLDVVFLPGFASEDEGGDAGKKGAEETTQNSRLLQILGVLVSLAGEAETSIQT